MNTRPSTLEADYDPYQLLRVYSYYRLLLGALLLLIYNNDIITNLLGSEDGPLFLYTCWVYTAINIMALVVIWRYKATPTLQQRFLAVFIDIVAITLLMYASGGANGGLGYLFLVAVAAAGMLLPAQLAIFCAALATIGLIGESLVQYFTYGIDNKALFVSGYLGALIFLTTLTFQYITGKMRHSKAQVIAQQKHVAHLQKLARLIVERMRTGIVVLNKHHDIELINNAAKELLGLGNTESLSLSVKQLPEIDAHIKQWQSGPQTPAGTSLTLTGASGSELRLSMAKLELSADTGTLIFVEDNRALAQQAQQLKLASLGRLTASIAHEIRNPLGAIGHATQLLAESADLSAADVRLLDIINNHTKRVNQIIENIFQVSKRKLSEPQIIDLNTWLASFIDDYSRIKFSENNVNSIIELRFSTETLSIRFDASQLQQVIENLLDNALRYVKKDSDTPAIRLETGLDPTRNTPFLHIIDNGPGIDTNNQKHVFEPFFTTESTGSGLGLFLCKELCEANQAFISYIADDEHPSCFTIQFAHTEKVQ